VLFAHATLERPVDPITAAFAIPAMISMPNVHLRLRLGCSLCVAFVLLCASHHVAANEAALWKALRSPDHVGVIRHALAPGGGDPPGFSLGDCDTQRNLSNAGRAQARRIGVRFRESGITTARLYSSQWCRCLETARLLGLGAVDQLPLLNSFFERPERGERQNRALINWLAQRDPQEITILVTHQVNITALSGVYPASGEIVILKQSADGGLSAIGTIRTD
jgi:phosphohistidine phosphatase SixA